MLKIGDQLGEFSIRRLLGRGGMGEVYEAFEPSLGRLVALKVMPDWLSQDPEALDRFQREASVAAQLEHPNIVPIHTWGQAEGCCFFTMKLIRGVSLSDFIKRRFARDRRAEEPTEAWRSNPAEPTPRVSGQGESLATPPESELSQEARFSIEEVFLEGDKNEPDETEPAETELADTQAVDSSSEALQLPIAQVLAGLHSVFERYCHDRFAFAARVGEQLAGALSYAHGMGQIHRDLKPSNVMIDHRGDVYLIDFGLTRAIASEATQHRRGTPRYMSPEQVDLHPLDGRTDIYSLGVTLYETVASELPFDAPDESSVAHQIRSGSVIPIEETAPGISERLAFCIQRAMYPSPAGRFQTAAELAEELAACRQDSDSREGQRPAVSRANLRKRNRAVRLTAFMTLVVLFAGALIFGLNGYWTDDLTGDNVVDRPKEKTPSAEKIPQVKPPGPGIGEPNAGDTITNSIGMQLVFIPDGHFWMGSLSELPRHKVTLTRGFFLGVYEVTRAEYEKVMKEDPSVFTAKYLTKKKKRVFGEARRFWEEYLKVIEKGEKGNYPADSISWFQATKFCEDLSDMPDEKQAGRKYRLPTEAEWEYACRAKTTSPFHYGSVLSSNQANFGKPYGDTPAGPLRKLPVEVGSFEKNAFGVFDMHGNLMEWCSDCFGNYRRGDVYDPQGASLNSQKTPHTMRGGHYESAGHAVRSASRQGNEPNDDAVFHGFRVVCQIDFGSL